MDHPAGIFRFISGWERRQAMAFREVLVTQVKEVLRAWLAGAGKRPAARRADVDVKTAMRYIKAAQAAGLVRDGDGSQLTDELLGAVVAAARPASAHCGSGGAVHGDGSPSQPDTTHRDDASGPDASSPRRPKRRIWPAPPGRVGRRNASVPGSPTPWKGRRVSPK